MNHNYSSLFSTHSRQYSHSNLYNISNCSKIITISVGVYFCKHYTNYIKQKDLPYLFTKELNGIVSTNPRAFCIHSGHTSTIYLFSDYEEQNYKVCTDISVWMTKLQAAPKGIRFCAGFDRRLVNDSYDIMLSELMAQFRMYQNIHGVINSKFVIMDRSVSIINAMREILNDTIECSNYTLQSEDVMEMSTSLDELINMYMCGEVGR